MDNPSVPLHPEFTVTIREKGKTCHHHPLVSRNHHGDKIPDLFLRNGILLIIFQAIRDGVIDRVRDRIAIHGISDQRVFSVQPGSAAERSDAFGSLQYLFQFLVTYRNHSAGRSNGSRRNRWLRRGGDRRISKGNDICGTAETGQGQKGCTNENTGNVFLHESLQDGICRAV